MSNLASLLARELIQQRSGGISDEQVENFLKLYDQQVPDSIKQNSEAREKLLETSKRLARSIDDYDMPQVTVTVQDFRFNPPSIQSELPCQLQFRVLPHSSRQQISVLNNSKKAVSTSGILYGGDTFTATICDPGSYTFTSEVYPFMSGQLTAERTVEEAAALAATKRAGTPGAAGKAALPDQQQVAHQCELASLDTGALSTAGVLHGQLQGRTADTGTRDVAAAGGAAAAAAAAAFAVCGLKRISDASDGLSAQASEHDVLELLSGSPTAASRMPPAQHGALSAGAATADIATIRTLSRAGRWARRATAYADELDKAPNMSSLHTSISCAATDAASGASHFSVQICNSVRSTVAAAATAAAATSAAHANAATCGAAVCANGPGVAGGSVDTCSNPCDEATLQDMDIDDGSCTAQNGGKLAAAMPPLMGFAKGLEALTLRPEQLKAEVCDDTLACLAGSSGAGMTTDLGAFSTSTAQERVPALLQLGSQGSGDYQNPAGWYVRLRSDSDHSSVSSDTEQHDHAHGIALDCHEDEGVAATPVRRAARGEGVHFLTEQLKQPHPSSGGASRFKAWGDDGASEDDRSSSDDASDDVRLRSNHGLTVFGRRRPVQRQQQQQCPSPEEDDNVLIIEECEDGDDPTMSTAVALAVQKMAADAVRAASCQQQPQQGQGSRAHDRGSNTTQSALDTALPELPGSKWNLGGKAYQAASVSVKSTFSGTEQAGSEHTIGISSIAASGSSPETKCTPSYFERLTSSSSRTHIALDVSDQSVNNNGASTLLGPGTHLIGRQTLRHCTTTTTNGNNGADDPVAQYARLHELRKAAELRNKQHLLQLSVQDGSDSGTEDVPPLRARLEQQRYAAAGAAGAAQASMQQSTGAAGRVNSSIVGGHKKKKGRGKASEVDPATVVHATSATAAATRAAATAAEAKRRERDHLECALWDKGSSGRGDSEDETASSQARPGALSLPAAATSHSVKPHTQLSKCKFKACKLTFGTMLNKHRCQMSHLPSARNATTKTHKAEMVAFLQALPPAALAQLLRLPEPASLPRHSRLTLVQAQQQAKASKGGSSSITTTAVATTKSSPEAAATAVAISRLQSSKLSDAWLTACLSAASDADGAAAIAPLHLSELAQLCCGLHAEGEQRISLLRRGSCTTVVEQQDSQQQQQQQQLEVKRENTAAAALAAAHVAGMRGGCCSVCKKSSSSNTLELSAARQIMQCSCRCHPASHDSAQQQTAQLPPLEHILSLLEQASEGTWLCNPRLLQQPHPGGCSCSVCLGLVPDAGATWSPEAVMTSISSGLDVLDVLGEWGVNDAGLSYAVERRLVTAIHKAKDAEAARIMSQLLEEDAPAAAGSGKAGNGTIESQRSGQHQLMANATTASQGTCNGKATGKKKDRKKAGKNAKSGLGAAARKAPAWKAVSSDSEASGDSDTEAQADAATPAAAEIDPRAICSAGSVARLVGPAGRMTGSRSVVFADQPCSPQQAVFDSPSKGRQLAEQLLQARLLQQDQELGQLLRPKELGRQLQVTDQRLQTRNTVKQQLVKQQNAAPEQGKVTSLSEVKRQPQAWQKPQPTPSGSRLEGSACQASHPAVRMVSRPTFGDKRANQQQQQPPPPPPKAQVRVQQQLSKQSSLSACVENAATSRPSSSDSSKSGSSLKGYAAIAAAAGGVTKSHGTLAVQEPTSATGLTPKPAAIAAAAEVQQAPAAIPAAPMAAEQQAAPAAGALPYSKVDQAIVACGLPVTESQAGLYAAGEHSSNVPSSSSSPETETPSVVAPAAWPADPCEAALEGQQQAPSVLQPHEQLQWQQHQHYQQHHAALLHQHWLAAAHQQAVQDMLIYSGRAAAAATGQELLPFTPQEQQYIAHWAQFYYYQQAYLGLAATQQQQQQQQQQQLAVVPAGWQARHGTPQCTGSATPTGGGSCTRPQQDQEMQRERHDMQERAEVQQLQRHAQHHEGEFPSFRLQFGSFPAEFMFASPGDASPKGSGRHATSPHAVTSELPCAGGLEKDGAAAQADGRHSMPCKEQQQQGAPAGASEQYMYWWVYQQQHVRSAHLQEQGPAAAGALEAPLQQQPDFVPAAAAVALVGPDAGLQTGSPQQEAEKKEDAGAQASTSRRLAPNFLVQMAAAMGSTVAAAAAEASSNSSQEGPSGEQRDAWAPLRFNAHVASQLLESRWDSITQQLGYPHRCAALSAPESTADLHMPAPVAALATNVAATSNISSAAAVLASKGVWQHAPHQRRGQQHSRVHTSRGRPGAAHAAGNCHSKPSGNGVWQVKQQQSV